MSDFPSYSPDAAYCLDELFFQRANDINFYFEDENHEAFYELLLERLFPHINISKVFCLGGKTNVLNKFKENKGINPLWKCIYVVDKDYDDLLGKIRFEEQIIYTQKYSIENYLFEPNAILDILIEELKGVKKSSLRNELALDSFYRDLLTQLTTATKLFVVAQKYRTGLPSTKQCHSDFMVQEEGGYFKICDKWLNSYRENLLTKIQQIKNLAHLERELEKALIPQKKYAITTNNSSDTHICGKHILSATWEYIRNKKGVNKIDPYLLAIRLLGKVDINKFNFLKAEIESVGHRFTT